MTATFHAGTYQVRIPTEQVVLNGELTFPDQAHGLVLFVHANGGNGRGPENLQLARSLQAAGLATLLLDLRSNEERQRLTAPHAVGVLADRLLSATEWVELEAETGQLQLGYFASGAGAGPALVAAAKAGHKVHALVLRGGHPELAREWLSEVVAPTLLLVGQEDRETYQANHDAEGHLHCPHQLTTIPGDGHSYEAAGALEAVQAAAALWFGQHLHRMGW